VRNGIKTVGGIALALLSAWNVALAGDEPAPKPASPEAEKPAKQKGKLTPEERKARRAKRKAERAKRLAERQKNRRQLDTDSPEAFLLQKKLAVPSRLAKDGTVKLAYNFTDPAHAGDFRAVGFETDMRAGPAWRKHRWQGRNPRFLALSVSSRKRGLLRHELDLSDEFTVTFRLRVDRMTRRSDLILFVGKSGVRFGNQLVVASGSRFRRVGRQRPDAAPFQTGLVTVKLQVKDGGLTAWVNGKQTAEESKKLRGKLDGRIGLYASDMNLVLFGVEIEGKIDKAKL